MESKVISLYRSRRMYVNDMTDKEIGVLLDFQLFQLSFYMQESFSLIKRRVLKWLGITDYLK